jgi:diguanylate cyclase (GGDEF)-like protein
MKITFKNRHEVTDLVKKNLGEINLKRTRIISIVLASLQIILIALDLLGFFGVFETGSGDIVFLIILHGMFSVFLVAYLISIRVLKKNRSEQGWKIRYRLSIAGTIIILLICALISVIDQSIHGEITVYIAGAFSIAALIYLPTAVSFLVFIPPLVLLVGGITTIQPEINMLIPNYINSVIFTGIAFIFSRVLFSHYLHDFKNLTVIKKQNRQLEERKEELKHQAYEDSLTALYNRRYAEEQLIRLFEHSKRYSRALTIAFADLDRFKEINDNYSHQTGDKALATVADIFRRNIRKTDIAARYGGEEFLLLFPETEIDEAYTLCERIRTSIESYPWHVLHKNLQVTISVGLADCSTSSNYKALMKLADEKLYMAKETGRNRTIR